MRTVRSMPPRRGFLSSAGRFGARAGPRGDFRGAVPAARRREAGWDRGRGPTRAGGGLRARLGAASISAARSRGGAPRRSAAEEEVLVEARGVDGTRTRQREERGDGLAGLGRARSRAPGLARPRQSHGTGQRPQRYQAVDRPLRPGPIASAEKSCPLSRAQAASCRVRTASSVTTHSSARVGRMRRAHRSASGPGRETAAARSTDLRQGQRPPAGAGIRAVQVAVQSAKADVNAGLRRSAPRRSRLPIERLAALGGAGSGSLTIRRIGVYFSVAAQPSAYLQAAARYEFVALLDREVGVRYAPRPAGSLWRFV